MLNVRAVKIENLNEARKILAEVGPDAGGIAVMAPKAVHRVIKVENLSLKAAIMLKQEMLSKGGEAAVSRGVGDLSVVASDVLLMATARQFRSLIPKLKAQPFGLAKLAELLAKTLDNLEGKHYPEALSCRGYNLPLGKKTLVMGILNVTPDSFSDGGSYFDIGKAIDHAHQMVEAGADIIDIGGESTRPKADYVPAEEELERVIPVLKRLVQAVKVPVSIDTYKAQVARHALEEGAHIINDVWGFKADKDMAGVVAAYPDVPVVLMHNQKGHEYKSLMDDILSSLRESVSLGLEAGVKAENIILDPGIGFGKDAEQNLEVMHRLWEFKTLGYPLLLGTSRKSFIGNTLELPVTDRVEGTAATVSFGITQGADIVRVHDVKEMARVAKMTDAMYRRL